MTKRKRAFPTIDEILARPWCYYCERDFDDHKILVGHQKAKHFKCPQPQCTRRLNTAGGLGVHMMQVHKVQLQVIENALPNRKDINIEIFAMEGIPQDVLDAHKQRITTEYFQRVAEHRAQTGNPLPGTISEEQQKVKKPKIETPEELRKRLAEHKAKREAERRAQQLGGDERGSITPTNSADRFTLPNSGEASAVQGSPMQVDQFAVQTPPTSGFPAPFPAPFAPSPGAFMPAGSPVGMIAPFGAPPGMPPGLPPGMPPSMPPGMPPGQFMPPGLPALPHGMTPPGMPVGAPQYSPMPYGPPPGMPAMPEQHFGAVHKPQQPRPTSGPDLSKQSAPLDTDVPGLPARPIMAVPNYSREDMARLHAGAPAIQSPTAPQNGDASGGNTSKGRGLSDSIDDLILSVRDSQQNTNGIDNTFNSSDGVVVTDTTQTIQEIAQNTAKISGDTTSKKAKKSKSADSKTKLVYSDNATSPEEKRASSSRYAFKREDATQYVLGDAGPAVTGAVRGPDDIMDSQSAH